MIRTTLLAAVAAVGMLVAGGASVEAGHGHHGHHGHGHGHWHGPHRYPVRSSVVIAPRIVPPPVYPYPVYPAYPVAPYPYGYAPYNQALGVQTGNFSLFLSR